MNEEEKELAEKLGIISEQKTIYLYKGHTYDNIKDAINYAEKDTKSDVQQNN